MRRSAGPKPSAASSSWAPGSPAASTRCARSAPRPFSATPPDDRLTLLPRRLRLADRRNLRHRLALLHLVAMAELAGHDHRPERIQNDPAGELGGVVVDVVGGRHLHHLHSAEPLVGDEA